MIIRDLCKKDAGFMLEWLLDSNINQFFQFDSSDVTIEDAEKFIENANTCETTRHFAVADDNDEYLGTISLKNINMTNRNAEIAISFRSKAHGTGITAEAFRKVITNAFENYGLIKIYLNVLSNNGRAISFYEKNGFVYEGEFKNHVCIKNHFYSLKWFAVFKEGWNE